MQADVTVSSLMHCYSSGENRDGDKLGDWATCHPPFLEIVIQAGHVMHSRCLWTIYVPDQPDRPTVSQ